MVVHCPFHSILWCSYIDRLTFSSSHVTTGNIRVTSKLEIFLPGSITQILICRLIKKFSLDVSTHRKVYIRTPIKTRPGNFTDLTTRLSSESLPDSAMDHTKREIVHWMNFSIFITNVLSTFFRYKNFHPSSSIGSEFQNFSYLLICFLHSCQKV